MSHSRTPPKGGKEKLSYPHRTKEGLNERIADHENTIYDLANKALRKYEEGGSPVPVAHQHHLAAREPRDLRASRERMDPTEISDLTTPLASDILDKAQRDGIQRAQNKYEYHIKNLENDKQSLVKRFVLYIYIIYID